MPPIPTGQVTANDQIFCKLATAASGIKHRLKVVPGAIKASASTFQVSVKSSPRNHLNLLKMNVLSRGTFPAGTVFTCRRVTVGSQVCVGFALLRSTSRSFERWGGARRAVALVSPRC